MSEVAIIVAHPDDEALGCGGTILRHQAHGDRIHLLYLTDGVSARDPQGRTARRAGLHAALEMLKPASVVTLDFPDNRLDTVALLDIVKKIEEFATVARPAMVYTHHAGDLNIDHAVTARAVLTAFRPLPGSSVKRIVGFEVLSSTEWAPPGSEFQPNFFVDISTTLADKERLLRCYEGEMRPAPHSRSHETVKALAAFRGHSVGLAHAEAFHLIREIA